MPLKNRVDLHMHTDNSDDAQHSVILMCEYAQRRGLRAVAITDHCECNRYKTDRFDRAIRQSFFESVKARASFRGSLVVLAGMELGQALQNLEAAEDALAANSYDFVIGSLHNVEGEADFWKVDYTQKDPRELLDRYFHEIYELVRWNRFDSLAHLTYPLRYIVGVEHIDIDLRQWSEPIDEILKTLASNGKALEINTSGLRQPYGKALPHLEIVRRFRELGGEYITVGADAHCCEDVGANIEDGLQIALQAGFRYVSLYQHREPMPVPIE